MIYPVDYPDVRELRRRYGESQETFARRLGVTRHTIYLWERRRCTPIQLAREALERLAAESPGPVEA